MAITKIQSESLNLADDFAFTGTITGAGGVSKPYFLATINSEQTVSDNVNTKVQFSNEIIDSDGCYDPSTNYRFTPTTAGKYYVSCAVGGTAFGADSLNDMEVSLYKNGSLYMRTRHNASNNYQYWLSPTVNAIVDMNGSTDYLEVYAQLDVVANTPRFYHSLYSWFMAHKIIG